MNNILRAISFAAAIALVPAAAFADSARPTDKPPNPTPVAPARDPKPAPIVDPKAPKAPKPAPKTEPAPKVKGDPAPATEKADPAR